MPFTHTEYAHDYHTFCTNPTYRNAIALCLMQIGELVKHPSPEFISLHTSIPWRAIRGMRNVVAHEYGNIDLETVWETSEAGIMELRDFCDEHIAANDFEIPCFKFSVIFDYCGAVFARGGRSC